MKKNAKIPEIQHDDWQGRDRGRFAGILLQFSRCFLLILVFSACSPERQMARILKNHPELIKTTSDTIWGKVDFKIPAIRIDTAIKLDKDYSKVDSIIDRYGNKLDSLSSIKLKQEINYYVTNKSILKDTAVFIQDNITVKIWEQDGLLRYRITKPAEIVHKQVATVVNTSSVVITKYRTFWERTQDFLLDNILVLLLILVLAYLILKKKL